MGIKATSEVKFAMIREAVSSHADGKSDVECMAVLKEAYEGAMVLLGFSIYFNKEE